MADTRHEAVWTWLQSCPQIRDLFFCASQESDGATVLTPLTSHADVAEVEYLDGSTLRRYDFALSRYDTAEYEPNDARNVDALCDAEAVAAWVDAQGESGSFPAFPADCAIQRVYALPSDAGSVAQIDGKNVKFLLQFRIEYLKEG